MKEHHSHRPASMHQANKPFKSKHATKGQLKEQSKGKVNRNKVAGTQKKVSTKADRRNAAKLAQKSKREEIAKLNRSVGGTHGSSKLIAVISLCEDVDAKLVFEKIVSHPDLIAATEPKARCPASVNMEKFRQKFTFFYVEHDLPAILEACRVADYLVLAFSTEEEVDKFGELCLAAILAQGVPSVVSVAMGIDALPPKKKGETKKALISYIADFFPDDQKLFSVDSETECLNLLRHLSTSHPKNIVWRDRHPYMLVESLDYTENANDSELITLKLTGYSRGRPFSANRLVHLANYGDFQVEKIEASHDPLYATKFTQRKDRQQSVRSDTSDMTVDSTTESWMNDLAKRVVLHVPNNEDKDDLVSENTPDPLANEQTILTDEELRNAEVQYDEIKKWEEKKKKVPKGTSSYQAAWIIEDDNEEGGDDDDEEEDIEENGVEKPYADDQMSEAGQNDEGEEMEELEDVDVENRDTAFDDQIEEEERESDFQKYLAEKARQSRDDVEFPDEVDSPLDVPCYKRFAKYRGLKSFRTSPWDPYENLPIEYGRIFDFQNFKRTQKRVLEDQEGVPPYCYVTIHILNVPKTFVEKYKEGFSGVLVLFGLLQHEHKTSVVHFVVNRHPSYEQPIKSKDPVIIYSGFRVLDAQPIYSQHTSGNKHKFERFFQFGRASVATIYGPIQYPPGPVLFFKDNGPEQEMSLIATGSLLGVDPRRVVVKRIILTGNPYKINRRHATIRYMFFNPQDIRWFKPIELRTKYGRIGHIKESLGTHGYMKCVFNGQLKAQDTVCMYLYKRVFPKWKAQLHQDDYVYEDQTDGMDAENGHENGVMEEKGNEKGTMVPTIQNLNPKLKKNPWIETNLE